MYQPPSQPQFPGQQFLQDPVVTNMAMQYGEVFANQGRDFVQQNVSFQKNDEPLERKVPQTLYAPNRNSRKCSNASVKQITSTLCIQSKSYRAGGGVPWSSRFCKAATHPLSFMATSESARTLPGAPPLCLVFWDSISQHSLGGENMTPGWWPFSQL